MRKVYKKPIIKIKAVMEESSLLESSIIHQGSGGTPDGAKKFIGGSDDSEPTETASPSIEWDE